MHPSSYFNTLNSYTSTVSLYNVRPIHSDQFRIVHCLCSPCSLFPAIIIIKMKAKIKSKPQFLPDVENIHGKIIQRNWYAVTDAHSLTEIQKYQDTLETLSGAGDVMVRAVEQKRRCYQICIVQCHDGGTFCTRRKHGRGTLTILYEFRKYDFFHWFFFHSKQALVFDSRSELFNKHSTDFEIHSNSFWK